MAGGLTAAAEQLLVGVDSGSVLRLLRAGPFFAVESGPGRWVIEHHNTTPVVIIHHRTSSVVITHHWSSGVSSYTSSLISH